MVSHTILADYADFVLTVLILFDVTLVDMLVLDLTFVCSICLTAVVDRLSSGRQRPEILIPLHHSYPYVRYTFGYAV